MGQDDDWTIPADCDVRHAEGGAELDPGCPVRRRIRTTGVAGLDFGNLLRPPRRQRCPTLFDCVRPLLKHTQPLNALQFGIVPLYDLAGAVSVDLLYPVGAAPRNDGVGDHAATIARVRDGPSRKRTGRGRRRTGRAYHLRDPDQSEAAPCGGMCGGIRPGRVDRPGRASRGYSCHTSSMLTCEARASTKRAHMQMLLRLSRTILTASLLMIGCADAFADSHVVGLGNQTCGTWTANPTVAGGIGLLYQQWLFGFVTGVSVADPSHDPLSSLDAAAVTLWIDDYCRNTSTARLVDAATAFVRAHGATKN
jgi:hypothetical protein